jgi:hypothetical protein
MQTLQALDLTNNNIGDQGAKYLATALQSNANTVRQFQFSFITN